MTYGPCVQVWPCGRHDRMTEWWMFFSANLNFPWGIRIPSATLEQTHSEIIKQLKQRRQIDIRRIPYIGLVFSDLDHMTSWLMVKLVGVSVCLGECVSRWVGEKGDLWERCCASFLPRLSLQLLIWYYINYIIEPGNRGYTYANHVIIQHLLFRSTVVMLPDAT